ncbi:MAG: divergent polysaccharide deacetylase family protein [Rhodobacteraceae bacterium]|nr:divergent polysaccharide deacetylase family protein [Paracoccaceae bacterium]
MGRSVLTGFLAGLGLVAVVLAVLSLVAPGPRPGGLDVAVLEPPPEPVPVPEPVPGQAQAEAPAMPAPEGEAAAVQPPAGEAPAAKGAAPPAVAPVAPEAPAAPSADESAAPAAAAPGDAGPATTAAPAPFAAGPSPEAAPAAGAPATAAPTEAAGATPPAVAAAAPVTPPAPDPLAVAAGALPRPGKEDGTPPAAPWVPAAPAAAPEGPAPDKDPGMQPRALVVVAGPSAAPAADRVAAAPAADPGRPRAPTAELLRATVPDPAPGPQEQPPPPARLAEAPAVAEAPPAAEAPAPSEDGMAPKLPVIISPEGKAGPRGTGDAPKPGLRNAAGVKVNRLPTIGGAGSGAGEDAPGAEAAPAPGSAPAPSDLPPVARFAAALDNPAGQPVLGIVLIDLGEDGGGLDPATIASLKAPLTVALDPGRSDAAARAATFRAAGFEVAILVPDLPAGASASDVEVLFQGWQSALPEAVALVTRPGSRAETDRRLVQHLVALAGAGGLGLVTGGSGLNPAAQLAGPAGVRHARALRWIDGKGENAEAVRRGLDRGAFAAEREGAALVIATTRPETVTALYGWLAEGGREILPGPATAVLK